MIYDVIPISVLILSLIALAVVLIRKFPELSAIDVDSIPRERQIEVKKSLIKNRLLKKIQAGKERMKESVKPFESLVRSLLEGLRDSVSNVEEKYRDKQRELIKDRPELTEQKTRRLFHEAEEAAKAEDLDTAEKRYIEIVKMDPQNIKACRNLGYIYLKQKDYEHAREMFEYNLRIGARTAEGGFGEDSKKGMVAAYRDLGTAYRAAEDYGKALENFKRAYEIEPKSPKNLDLLIEISIILKEAGEARTYLGELEEVNPGNQKLERFRQQIEEFEARGKKLRASERKSGVRQRSWSKN